VASEPAVTDGRNLRRDRNRGAVVDALLALYREGVLAPGAEAIAARAGISVRSLYRYFDDVPALVRTAIAHQQQRLAPLYALDIPAGLPFDERAQLFVSARVRLLDAMGAVGRLARSVAANQPLVLGELTRIRRTLRDQLAETFAPELDRMSPSHRQAAMAAADVVCSWESYDLMCHDQGLAPAEAAEAIRAALLALLGPQGGA
jgi:AcrR family transcriptional regulator